eukprot:scaffold201672_cov30-Cyclotella_meneghiniana.AAC.1
MRAGRATVKQEVAFKLKIDEAAEKKAQLELEKRHKNVEQMQSVLSVVGSSGSGKVEIEESRKQEIKAWTDCKI